MVAIDHFRELHGEIVLICRAGIDHYSWSDTNRRRRHMRHEQVSRLAQTRRHMEKLDVIFLNLFKDLLHLEWVELLNSVLE